MPKMLIDAEEAKKVLLDHYKKSNPDVTEIVIEGLITISEANKLLSVEPGRVTKISPATTAPVPLPEVVNASDDVFDRPGQIVEKLSPQAPIPNDPEMIALVQRLQQVTDDGRILHIKYLTGPNKGYDFELTKGLESRCTWCGYVAMSDKDLGDHKNQFHKEVVAEEKRLHQIQLDKAKQDKQQKIQEHDAESGGRGSWGKKTQ